MADSKAEIFKRLTPEQQVEAMSRLSPEEQASLLYMWEFWARPEQIAPGGLWSHWLILAGRGWGKTRTGAEFIKESIRQGKSRYIALVGATHRDVSKTMVEGESGLLNLYPESERPVYNPTKNEIAWPVSKWAPYGAKAFMFTAEEPERLRGPQHDTYWADELCAWKYTETWDQLQFGLRLGKHVRGVITTTPKPTPLLKSIYKGAFGPTVVTKGVTWDNSGNLAENTVRALRERYENTRLGRQELNAEILDDNPGALWKRDWIEQARVTGVARETLKNVVVAIDPAVTCREGASDETGIIVAGVNHNNEAFILEDLSGTYSPEEWGRYALLAYRKYKADAVVAEVNQGGDMVHTNLKVAASSMGIKYFRYEPVRATKGKAVRAEPAAALYEQLRVHHVGNLPNLEDQMCEWNPQDTKSDSPDRMDALVWALTHLIITKRAPIQCYSTSSLGLF